MTFENEKGQLGSILSIAIALIAAVIGVMLYQQFYAINVGGSNINNFTSTGTLSLLNTSTLTFGPMVIFVFAAMAILGILFLLVRRNE